MTHQSIHLDFPVQKAGQAVGTALPNQPLPRYRSSRFRQGTASAVPEQGPEHSALATEVPTGGSVRVAGGETMSKKTSTAALDSFCQGSLPIQRRAPHHPARARISGKNRSMQQSAREVDLPNLAATHHEVQPLQLVSYKEDTMNAITSYFPRRNFRAILPVIFRITLSLLLWTLGAAAMDIRVTPIQPKEHHVVFNFPVDRAKAEDLQRWVNAGHDPWCRDPQLVAVAALRRISPDLAEVESVSLSPELQHNAKTKAVYTFHSLDGRTTYRITLRRYPYLLPTAGSLHRIIWIPETAEIITRDTQN